MPKESGTVMKTTTTTTNGLNSSSLEAFKRRDWLIIVPRLMRRPDPFFGVT